MSWWQFVILSLGAFRLVRIIGWDDITIRPRRWLTGLGDEEHKQWAYVLDHAAEVGDDPWQQGMRPDEQMGWWYEQTVEDATGSKVLPPLVLLHGGGPPPVSRHRYTLSKLVRCPWCVGFYIAVLVWLTWEAWPHATTVTMTPLAIAAAIGLVAKTLDG